MICIQKFKLMLKTQDAQMMQKAKVVDSVVADNFLVVDTFNVDAIVDDVIAPASEHSALQHSKNLGVQYSSVEIGQEISPMINESNAATDEQPQMNATVVSGSLASDHHGFSVSSLFICVSSPKSEILKTHKVDASMGDKELIGVSLQSVIIVPVDRVLGATQLDMDAHGNLYNLNAISDYAQMSTPNVRYLVKSCTTIDQAIPVPRVAAHASQFLSKNNGLHDVFVSINICLLGSSRRPPPTSVMLFVDGISARNIATCRLGSRVTTCFHPCILWCSTVYPKTSFYCVRLAYEFQFLCLGDTISVTFKRVTTIMCILLCASVVIASHLISFMPIWNFDALTVASTLSQHHSNIVFNRGTCNLELGSLISKQLQLALRDTLVHTESPVKDMGGTAPIFFAYVPIYVTPYTLSIVESICTVGRLSPCFELDCCLLYDGGYF